MEPTHKPVERVVTRGDEEISLLKVLHAFADPVRLEIVRQLDEAGERACGMFGIDMPKSSLSHHFRILRQSGVIVSESQGTVLMNRLRREELDSKLPGLLTSVLAGVRGEIPRSSAQQTSGTDVKSATTQD
jgi:DNA-binding transcriptional ArsR family regulator